MSLDAFVYMDEPILAIESVANVNVDGGSAIECLYFNAEQPKNIGRGKLNIQYI